MDTDEQGRELADSPALARALGVTTNQIYMWNQRWENNGFPAPTHHRDRGVRPQYAPKAKFLWVLDEVLEWHRNYTPTKGGAGTHAKNRNRSRNDALEPTEAERGSQEQVLVSPADPAGSS